MSAFYDTEHRVIGHATGCGYLNPRDVQSNELIVRQGDLGSLDAPVWIPGGSVKRHQFERIQSVQQSFYGR